MKQLKRLSHFYPPLLYSCMLVVLLCFSGVIPLRSVEAKSQQFVVSSDVQWVNTGIVVKEGDRLNIHAKGSWSADPSDGFTTPDGYAKPWPDNFLNLTDLGVCSNCASTLTPHWGALIGYIGDNPPAVVSYTSKSILPEAEKVFFIGSHFNSSVKLSGTLWLNFNDDAYSAYTVDNAGSVTATVVSLGPHGNCEDCSD